MTRFYKGRTNSREPVHRPRRVSKPVTTCVKRRDLGRHLEHHGCKLFRKGGNQAIYINRTTDNSSAVPRHREINEVLVKKICKDLEVPAPSS